jgi:hypothetical protein
MGSLAMSIASGATPSTKMVSLLTVRGTPITPYVLDGWANPMASTMPAVTWAR